MRRLRKKTHPIFLLIKIIGICLLLLVPVNASGDDQQSPNYWPTQINQLQTLYAQHPNDPQITNSLANAYNNYGVLLAGQKQWREAESYLQQAVTLSNAPEIRKNLSNVYYQQAADLYKNRSTQYTTMITQLANKALSVDPQNVNAYLILGDVEYMNQNMRDAERAWKKAAVLVPNDASVQSRLAQITREAGAETDMNTEFNPHFNIKIDADVAHDTNFNVNAILDHAYNNVAPDFEFVQNFKVPVVVYNRQEYQDTMVDAPGWAEAIYDGKIRIAIRPNQNDFKELTSDVVHEYTHVVVAELTNNNCPRWFNEGIAKYEEYKHGVAPRIYLLAIAYNTNNIIPWSSINSAMLSQNKEQAVLAYQQAFSFVYFLVERYGMKKIVATLKLLGDKVDFDQALAQVYGIGFETLQKNWRLWLTEFITNWANVPATDGVDYQYQSSSLGPTYPFSTMRAFNCLIPKTF